jgi:hypothetical protein
MAANSVTFYGRGTHIDATENNTKHVTRMTKLPQARNCLRYIRTEVLTAVVTKRSVSLAITQWNPLKIFEISDENVASIFRV